jgi:hypothetical protein
MDRISPLLDQYPGPLKLPMSARQRVFLWLGTLALAMGSVSWVAVSGTVWSWLGAAFLLVCAGLFVRTLLRAEFCMILDSEGFSTTAGVQHNKRKWAEVCDFAVVKDEINPFETHIGFNLTSRARASGELPDWRDLTLDSYGGLTNAESVRLLSQWRERALAERSTSAA